MKNDWYKSAVGYQIYPKSFKDTNGDGLGDIPGMIAKLPYLKDLGIDFVWVNPIYKSPQVDGGYDIADFEAIDPMFGDMQDLKTFIEEAHKLDIKVIMDLIVNHTSDHHPWFIESRKSKDNPYRDYYHWHEPVNNHEPNNWRSFFGGSVWEMDDVTGEYYFHIFAKEQPDLNWKNPKLRQEIYDMVRWWLEFGIDGFRLDAISHIQKEDWNFKIKSWKGNDPWQPFMNVVGIETYMRDLKAIFDDYDALTVGEASGVLSTEAPDWTDDNGYINMIFELEHNDVKKYKEVIMRWQKDMLDRGWNALYMENHDNPRSIDKFGDGTLASAKALAVQYMLLRGTPFIYQGQEIGMTNFPFKRISQVRTTDTLYAYNEALERGLSKAEATALATANTRDHSRTPMQWDASKHAGFTTDKPWIDINPNYKTINVAEDNELLELYKALIALRHDSREIADGGIEFLFEKNKSVMCYKRETYLIIVNLSAQNRQVTFDTTLEDYEVIMTSQDHVRINKRMQKLAPWDYIVLKSK